MVSGDPVGVENELLAGRLRCPGCADRLARWGRARSRNVRSVGGVERRVQPRRARCVGCWTHAGVVARELLVRRRDEVEVIGAALVAHVAGAGHRRIAERLGVPAATVRGWLRRFGSRADEIAGFFTQWALALAPGSDPPAPLGQRAWRRGRGRRDGDARRGPTVRSGPGVGAGGAVDRRGVVGQHELPLVGAACERAGSRASDLLKPRRLWCTTVIAISRCSGTH